MCLQQFSLSLSLSLSLSNLKRLLQRQKGFASLFNYYFFKNTFQTKLFYSKFLKKTVEPLTVNKRN